MDSGAIILPAERRAHHCWLWVHTSIYLFQKLFLEYSGRHVDLHEGEALPCDNKTQFDNQRVFRPKISLFPRTKTPGTHH